MGEGGEWELQVKEKAVETAFSMHIGLILPGSCNQLLFWRQNVLPRNPSSPRSRTL